MTIAIGTDIVEIQRIESVFQRQGDKLAKRILTSDEMETYLSISSDEYKIRFLSKRWCAKEAIAKALGTGIAQGVGFQQIQINHNDLGAPIVLLTGEALTRLESLGGRQALLTLSDERHYAVAFCALV